MYHNVRVIQTCRTGGGGASEHKTTENSFRISIAAGARYRRSAFQGGAGGGAVVAVRLKPYGQLCSIITQRRLGSTALQ